MKLNRRAFLQFAAGAVGGTLFSPLPWKLIDDSAIWTQNWRWRPKSQPGETSYSYSICRLCPGGCGIKVRLIDGKRAIFVSGNSNAPINKGGICPLGIASLQFLYAPYRLEGPVKQTGKRGDPKGFKPISWGEALEDVANRIKQILSDRSGDTVAGIVGDLGGSMRDLIRYFLGSCGSSNCLFLPSAADSQKLANFAMQGTEASIAFDLERANYILSFGADLLGGWGSPVRVQMAFSDLKTRGSKSSKTEIVQVDWRESYTASKATEWIPVLPGTEAALALGICHVIVRDKLYDKDFINNWGFGFEDWSDEVGRSHEGFKSFVLKNYPPDIVSKSTGVGIEKIVSVAHSFATKKPSLAIWGNGYNNVPGTLYHDMAFISLNALVGNLQKPGGLFDVVLPPLKELSYGELAKASIKSPVENSVEGVNSENNFPLPGNPLYAILDEIARGKSDLIKFLFLYEANPLYTLPEYKTYQKALNNIDFVVSFSSYLDETAISSDMILPNHMFLERWDDIFTPPGCPYSVYGISKPVLNPRKNTHHTGDFLLALAKKVGGDFANRFPWGNYTALLKSRLSGIMDYGKGKILKNEDITALMATHENLGVNFSSLDDLWDKLTSGYFWVDVPNSEGPRSFGTPSGKFEFYSQKIKIKNLREKKDELFLPHFFLLEPSGDPGDYPYYLISYSLIQLTDGAIGNPPFLTKLLSDTLLKGNDLFVQVNPATAARARLREGNRAILETPQGKVKILVHLTEEIPRGVLAMPSGLGHYAFDEYIQGKGVNVNSLIEVQQDPVTGIGTWWATRASIKITEV